MTTEPEAITAEEAAELQKRIAWNHDLIAKDTSAIEEARAEVEAASAKLNGLLAGTAESRQQLAADSAKLAAFYYIAPARKKPGRKPAGATPTAEAAQPAETAAETVTPEPATTVPAEQPQTASEPEPAPRGGKRK